MATKLKIVSFVECTYMLHAMTDSIQRDLERLARKSKDESERWFYEYVLETFDFHGFRSFAVEHNSGWCEPVKYLKIAYRFIDRLGLQHRDPVSIFDLASGPCWFGYGCKCFGHDVVGLDKPNPPVLQELASFLGVKFIPETIRPSEPLSKAYRFRFPITIRAGESLEEARCFDIATGWRTSFHKRSPQELWRIEDWQFFLDDLIVNHLRPGGEVHLMPSRLADHAGVHVFDPEFKEFVRKHGGWTDGRDVIFRSLESWRSTAFADAS